MGLLLSLSLLYFYFSFSHQKHPFQKVWESLSKSNYYLETAQTDQERKIGLSNRDRICPNCGMLFVFSQEGQHGFWMKDTHFPLDIIWLNSKKEIVKIITAATSDSETTYLNKTPAKYAIELPANESLKLDLKIGDIIPIFQD